MKWIYVLALSFALTGCNRKEQVTQASAAPTPPAKAGQVVLPVDSPKLRQLTIAEVATENVPSDEVLAPGKVELNPNRLGHVMAPVAGRVGTVLARIGDFVRQGQPLLTMESPDIDAANSAYLQTESALTQGRSSMLKAQADYDRAKDLFEHNAVAQKEVLNAQSALAQAKAAVEQAEATRKQAISKLQLLGLTPGKFGQTLTIHAPISGKVMEMSVVPGEFRNDTNASLMTIADLSTVWISSDVPETSIRLIQLNERLEIELAAFPGERFQARVTQIADVVDPQTRTIKVRAEIANPKGRLRPEMFGRIRHVEAWVQRPVVPIGAVIQGDTQNTVFVERAPGTFEAQPVQLGPKVGERIAVKEGIKPGDRIVVDGAMLLKGV